MAKRVEVPTVETEETDANGQTKPRHRSPNHPFLSLKDAVEKADAIFKVDRMGKVPVGVAHERFGYKRLSGIGDQCVAALKSYGLITIEGEAAKRFVSLTERANRILRRSPDREAQLRLAALEPAIHKELWDKYKEHGLPQDDVLREYLLWHRPGGTFNENVVDAFIERFKASLTYAGLGAGGKMDGGESDETDSLDEGESMPPGDEQKNAGRGFSPPADRPSPPKGMRDFPLYTASQRGALWVPESMTEDEYQLLKTQIESSLAVIKATGVRGPEKPA